MAYGVSGGHTVSNPGLSLGAQAFITVALTQQDGLRKSGVGGDQEPGSFASASHIERCQSRKSMSHQKMALELGPPSGSHWLAPQSSKLPMSSKQIQQIHTGEHRLQPARTSAAAQTVPYRRRPSPTETNTARLMRHRGTILLREVTASTEERQRWNPGTNHNPTKEPGRFPERVDIRRLTSRHK